jgi:hypothetical protein
MVPTQCSKLGTVGCIHEVRQATIASTSTTERNRTREAISSACATNNLKHQDKVPTLDMGDSADLDLNLELSLVARTISI